MQQRRGTAAQWTAANPILAAGEIGFETDTSKFKMGNGSSTWSALTYFANAAELAAVIDGAPDLLNTLNELAAAMGDDPAFITNHTTATTNVHGIANTALLSTTAGVNSAIAISAESSSQDATTKANAALTNALDAVTTHNADQTGVHGIADTRDLATATTVATAKSEATAIAAGDATNKADAAREAAITAAASAADTKISDHNADTSNVHGIPDTSLLATTANVATAKSEAITEAGLAANNSVSTAVSSLTKSAVGLDQVDNTSDANKPVSTATGTAIATAVSDHNADTSNVHGIADTSVLATLTDVTNAVNGAEVDQASLAGVGIDYNAVSEAFDLDNTYITTATQTALDLKAPKASPTFTGTVSGVTKAHVGLSDVDNTSDTAKPVSTAQATAIATAKSEAIAEVNALLVGAPAALNTLDELAAALGDDANFASTVTTNLAAKAPLASPTFTGTVTVAAAGVAFTDGTQTKAGVPSVTTIATTLAAGARTLAAGEQDKFVPLAGAVVITLPASGYSTGQSIDFYQESGTGASFASTNSVVGTPGLKFRTTNSVATALKTAAGWLVFGDLSA